MLAMHWYDRLAMNVGGVILGLVIFVLADVLILGVGMAVAWLFLDRRPLVPPTPHQQEPFEEIPGEFDLKP